MGVILRHGGDVDVQDNHGNTGQGLLRPAPACSLHGGLRSFCSPDDHHSSETTEAAITALHGASPPTLASCLCLQHFTWQQRTDGRTLSTPC